MVGTGCSDRVERRPWYWMAAVGLVVGAGASGLLGGVARAQEALKFGDVPTVANAGTYVAMEKGFFARRGIRLEAERFASAGKMNTALSTGQLDVAVGSSSAGLFNAAATGADIRIILATGVLKFVRGARPAEGSLVRPVQGGP